MNHTKKGEGIDARTHKERYSSLTFAFRSFWEIFNDLMMHLGNVCVRFYTPLKIGVVRYQETRYQ